MLFRDHICLGLDGPDLGKAQGIARDFRACTTTVMVGPAFLMAHGPSGVRSLRELGVRDVVIDARLFGDQEDLWHSVVEVAKLGAQAVTIHPGVGPRVLSLAVEAARRSMEVTNRVRPPLIIGAAMPLTITNSDLCRCYGTRHVRKTYLAKHATLCCQNGAAAMITEPGEIPHVRKVCNGLPLMVPVKRRVYGYDEVLPDDERSKPCVMEVLRKGAAHAIYNMEFAGRDAEWTAEMLNKELLRLDDP